VDESVIVHRWMEDAMCHSGYWAETARKKQEAREKEAQEKRAATIEGLRVDAERHARERHETPRKEHVPAK
jgi:hypothetical protein